MKTKKWNELTARVLTSLVFASFSGSTALAALPEGYTKGTDGAYIYTTNVSSDISGESGDKIVLGDGTNAMSVSGDVTGGYSEKGDVKGSSVTANRNVSVGDETVSGGGGHAQVPARKIRSFGMVCSIEPIFMAEWPKGMAKSRPARMPSRSRPRMEESVRKT